MPVPSTGTFKVYPLSIAQVDANGWAYTPDFLFPVAKDNQAAVDFLNSGVGNPLVPTVGTPGVLPWSEAALLPYPYGTTYTLEMFPDTAQIIFNPGGSQQIVDILSADFPAGFAATNIKVKLSVYISDISSLDDSFENLKLLYFGGAIKTFDLSGPQPVGLTDFESGAGDIVPVGTYFNAAQTFKSFGFQPKFFNSAGTHSLAYFFPVLVELSGDYISDASNLPSASPTTNLSVGDEITITGIEGENVYIETTVDGETVRVLIPTISTDPLIARITCPIIDGSVLLVDEVPIAILGPILADGSGVYKITTGKRNDTYYDRTNPLAPVTVDMKIPTPFIRTGFF